MTKEHSGVEKGLGNQFSRKALQARGKEQSERDRKPREGSEIRVIVAERALCACSSDEAQEIQQIISGESLGSAYFEEVSFSHKSKSNPQARFDRLLWRPRVWEGSRGLKGVNEPQMCKNTQTLDRFRAQSDAGHGAVTDKTRDSLCRGGPVWYSVSIWHKPSPERTVHSVSNGNRGAGEPGREGLSFLPTSPCSSLCLVQSAPNMWGNILTSLPLKLRLSPNVAFSKASSPPYAPGLGLCQCFTVTARTHCSTTTPLPTTPPTRCWAPWNHRLGPSLHAWGSAGCSVHSRLLINNNSNSDSSGGTSSTYLYWTHTKYQALCYSFHILDHILPHNCFVKTDPHSHFTGGS